MNAGELVDARGRKYLTAEERERFLAAVRATASRRCKRWPARSR